jgi:hypothetical protein
MARMSGIALALALAPGMAAADVVYLKGGGRVEGEIVEQGPDRVVIEVPAGRITLPRERVERLSPGASALAQYRARAARLPANDVEGWLALASWARDHDLSTQARAAFAHVLELQPANAEAHSALGHVYVNGRWMSADEGYRARGYVQFEGSWVRPEERQAMLEERAARAAQDRERAESDARIREADARARAADAEARRLAAQEQQPESAGIPYPFIFGGGTVIMMPPPEPPPPAPVAIERPRPVRERPRHAGQSPAPSGSKGGFRAHGLEASRRQH